MKNKLQNLLLVFFLGLGVTSLLSACQSQTATLPPNTPASALTSLPTAVLEPTLSAGDIRKAIITALLTLNTKSNRMNVTTVLEGGETHKTEIEFVPPDSKRIVADGTEIIVAGGKVYIKPAGAAQWEASQTPAATYLGETVTEQTLGATLGNVEYVRSESLAGQSMKLYRYSSTTKSGDIELHGQTDLWVGAGDGLPYKMVVDGETLAVSNDSKTGESKAQAVKAQTTTVIVFEPALAIEAPKP